MNNKKQEHLEQLIEALKQNKIVIIPTDTVLGILALKEEQVIELKQRKKSNKKTVRFIGSIDWINKSIPEDLSNLLKTYWPGALTIIYKGVGYRIPNNEIILEALNKLKAPIYASSANLTNNPVIESIEEAKVVFKNSNLDIAYIETTNSVNNIASTVYDYDNKKLLRKGQITKEEIEKYLY